MSVNTTFLSLELPELGAYPGTWGTVLNASFQKIDDALKAALSGQAGVPSEGAPSDPDFIDAGAGSLWYDTAINLLKVKTTGDIWVPVALHQHGVTEGIPAIDLSTDVDPNTTLSSSNVQYSGLDSEKLGHFDWSEYFRIAGTGLIASNQSIGLKTIDGLTTGEANIVTVDAYGRIVSAQKTASSVTLGLTDVLTLAVAAANYYNRTEIDSILGFSHLENGGSATVLTWADARYAVKSKEHDEAHSHPEYAPVAGSNLQKFAVAPLDTSVGTDSDSAMSKAQLDARYLLKAAVGGQTQDTITGEVKFLANAYYDPTNQIDGAAGDPADYELVNKKFVTDWITILNGNIGDTLLQSEADTLYHPLGGGLAPYASLRVEDPGADTNAAVPLIKLQTYVASEVAEHIAAGHTQYDNIALPNIDETVNTRNCILEAPLDSAGDHNWYTISGLDMQVSAPAPSANGNFAPTLQATCAYGFGGITGSKDVIIKVDDSWNWTGTGDVDLYNYISFPVSSQGFFGLQRDPDTLEDSWFYIEKDYTANDIWEYIQANIPAAPSANEYWLDTNTMQLYKWEEYDSVGDPGVYAWITKLMVPVGTWDTTVTDVTLSIYGLKEVQSYSSFAARNGSSTEDFSANDIACIDVGCRNITATGPVTFPSYTVAAVPDATAYTGAQIFVSDEVGGACMAFSNGTNWLRIYDNVIVS